MITGNCTKWQLGLTQQIFPPHAIPAQLCPHYHGVLARGNALTGPSTWPFSKICLKILCARLLADQQAPKSPSGVTGTALQGRLWVAVGRRSSTTSPCSTARSRLSLQRRHEMSSNSGLMRFYKHPSNLFHRRVHEKQSNSNFTESQMYGSLEYTYLEESTHNDISISLEIGLSQKQPHAGFSLACSTRKISSP